jgi:hypothetical protein
LDGAETVGHDGPAEISKRGIDSTNHPTLASTSTYGPAPAVAPVPASATTTPISAAETAKHLLSPSTFTRPRSSTVNSHTSAADSATGSGYESSSSEDSMLSFWSDDDSEDESMTEPEGPTSSSLQEGKEEKKEEKKKREEDRQKVLEQAGLKLRREPPGIPSTRNRRRAPDAPKSGSKRRAAPGLPPNKTAAGGRGRGNGDKVEEKDEREKEKEKEEEGKLDTLDAYARYENYLAQSQAQANQPRPTPPQPTSPTTTRPARSTSIISQPSSTGGGGGSGGGRFSGLISRIMAPTTSTSETQPRKSISIVRIDSESQALDGGEGGSEKEKGGGTWTSLVDPSVLGTMSDLERKRQEVSTVRAEGSERVQPCSELDGTKQSN